MTKSLQVLAAPILVVVVAACNASLDDVSPTQPPTQAATIPPRAVPTTGAMPDPRCPELVEGTQLLTHGADGYCFLYPNGWLRVDSSEHGVCLVPEGETRGCDDPVASFEVTDAEGRTAAQIADERGVGESGSGAGLCTAAIAGIQAVVLPQVADQGPMCEMLFVREDRLYTLKFALPDPDDTPEVGDALMHLFNTVTESFT